MNCIMLRTDDMLNGSGLRVVTFLSSCDHFCEGCHNPETWDKNAGEPFTEETKQKIFDELSKSYISGLTLSGGDPLNIYNREEVKMLVEEVKSNFPTKNIWLYTGYTWEQILENKDMLDIVSNCNVVVDGMFKKDLADVNYPWAGSTNQRIIDVKKSLKDTKVTTL